jgi:predicted RNase H-like nuclease
MTTVAGVDGCKGGWVVVLHGGNGPPEWRVERHFRDVLALPERPSVIAVDIPIGLLEAAERRGRNCDREARKLLGSPRGSSVFSPPVRAALQCDVYADANRVNRQSSVDLIGISQQCFGLRRKLCEVDALISPELQDTVYEVHPELCFFQMAGQPMKYGKKRREGQTERERLLVPFEATMTAFKARHPSEAKVDDLIDACAACWTAVRISEGRATSVPEVAQNDVRKLRMEIWR